jgi:tyrosyl-tRNA synthetase
MDRMLKPDNNPESFFQQLQQRGLIQDSTPKIQEYLHDCAAKGLVPKAYVGFDPSAPSLQVGNLVAASLLRRAQICGVQPIILIGGATGLIGDPSGKKEERVLQEKAVAAENCEKIKLQLANLIDTSPGKYQAIVRNNYEWFKDFGFLDFLRDVGKHMTINYMTAKDSVKIRMETGISYAEFGYMLVQGYDYLYLFEKEDCRIQLGGSDQWGNITTGLELIRRKHHAEAYAISTPLLTDSAGNKLGKSEKGAVFLDPKMTSPFQFYQYWLGQPDADMPKLMRTLSYFTMDYIAEIERQISAAPEKREAQKIFAQEITQMLHGAEAARGVESASQVLFSKDPEALKKLSESGLKILASEVPSSRLSLNPPIPLLDLLVQTKLCESKGEARRHVKANAVSINRQKVMDENAQVSSSMFADQPFLLLGLGKSNLHLVVRG